MVHSFRRVVLSAAVIFGTSALAVEPADNTIKSVMDDLSRFEQQVAANSSPSTLKRTLRLLELTRQRLDSSPNRSHASWGEADDRYNALLHRLRSPGPAASTTRPAQQAQATTPAPAPQPAPERQLISQDVARLNKLLRDIEGATETLDQGGIKPFQDPAYVQQYQQRAERFRQQLAAYTEFPDEPQVRAAAAALGHLDNLLAVGIARNAEAGQSLGDVQARLAAIYQRTEGSTPPAVPDPLTVDALEAWIAQLEQIRQHSATDRQELLDIKADSHLPLTRGTVEQGADFDVQNIDSMLAVLDRNGRSLETSLSQLAANLDAQIQHSAETLSFYDALDPADPQAQKNMFLGQGQMERGLAALDTEIARIKAAVAFDRRQGRGSQNDREDLLEQARDVRESYIEKRQQALELVGMPEEATDDAELLEIAKRVLQNPDYGVGDLQRVVINTDKSHYRRESSEVEFDDVDVSLSGDITLTGTETKTIYEWDEFQVATAEPMGDKFYIFYNTLRYFTAGATTTPLNRWVLSARLQSTEILKENIEPGWW